MRTVSHTMLPSPSTVRTRPCSEPLVIRFDQARLQRALLVFGICLFVGGVIISAGLPGGGVAPSPSSDDEEDRDTVANGGSDSDAEGGSTENESTADGPDPASGGQPGDGSTRESDDEKRESEKPDGNGTENSPPSGSGEQGNTEADRDDGVKVPEGNESSDTNGTVTDGPSGSDDPIFGGGGGNGSEPGQNQGVGNPREALIETRSDPMRRTEG